MGYTTTDEAYRGGPFPILTVNGKRCQWGDEAPRGCNVEVIVESRDIECASDRTSSAANYFQQCNATTSSSNQADDVEEPNTEAENSPSKIGEPIMLQTIEVIGDDQAVWRLKFSKQTRNLTKLFELRNPTPNLDESDTLKRVSRLDPSILISTPFSLKHVLLGDFWLEFMPRGPKNWNAHNSGAAFFKCGYPDLAVRVKLELLGESNFVPLGTRDTVGYGATKADPNSIFSNTFVASGGTDLSNDINAGAFLSVNFGMKEAWAADGDIRVRATLLDVVKLPPKLNLDN